MATSNAFHRFIQVEWEDKKVLPIDGLKTNESLQTITQALQRASHRIRHVDAYVKGAEEHFSGNKLSKLTYNEFAAVYAYTIEMSENSLYTLVNQALCSADSKAVKPWLPFLRLFYSAAKKLPDFQGECFRIGKAEFLDQIKSKPHVTWP
ncbi:unnamed protein product, partial [Rotaria sp. Silwood1]